MLLKCILPIAVVLLHTPFVHAAGTNIAKKALPAESSPMKSATDGEKATGELDYMQAGKLIYGVKRFDFFLSGVTACLRGEGAADSDDADANLADRIKVSDRYFAAHPAHASQQSDFLHVVRTIHRIEKNFTAPPWKNDVVAGHIGELRDAHLRLAKVAHALGCSTSDADHLREQAKRFDPPIKS